MKKVLIILAVALLGLSAMAFAGDEQPADKGADKPKAEKAAPPQDVPIAEYLIGKWDIAPNKRVLSGDIIFWNDGSYIKNEKHIDGVGAGTKGDYKLYTDQKPCGIDLCLGKCDQEGSEWTTLFGIVRKLKDGRVEILTSPDGSRPKKFGEKPDDEYTMILKRRADKE